MERKMEGERKREQGGEWAREREEGTQLRAVWRHGEICSGHVLSTGVPRSQENAYPPRTTMDPRHRATKTQERDT